MKKAEIVKSVNGLFSKTSFQLKKHSPEILVVAGVIGVVTSAVMACKATTKVNEILDKTKEDVEAIHKCEEDESMKEQYSSEDAKKDLTIVYAQTGVKFAKLYGPSVVLGALSITSILASNNILRKRNVALGAAYAAIDKGFKEYRNRVIERFGEEVDRELKYNLKAKKFEETVVDEETGKEKKVKKNGFVVSPADISGYARFFEKYTQDEDGNSILNPHWESNNEYNLMFIKAQERYANDLLKAKKRVFLNDVYEMLGLPRTKAGQIVGIADEELAGIGPTAVFFFVLRRRIIEVTIVESTHGQIDARVVAHRRKPHILALALQLAIDENPYRARRLVISACDMVPYAFVQDFAGITTRALAEGRTAARTVELLGHTRK